VAKLLNIRANGRGISKIISMSNTRKITASKKNRVENGIRALFLGSNPHSNGDDFSRSLKDRALKMYAMVRIMGGRTTAIIAGIRGISIHKGYNYLLLN
jgi:hypothetical protein